MYNKKQLLILTAAGILVLVLGGFLGAAYFQPQKEKINVANNLSSKVISSIAAYGQVQNINGRNITLNNLGDSMVISMAENAQVYAFSPSGKNNSMTQRAVSFQEIKTGESVNIIIKLLPSGQMQGTSVAILPITPNK